MVRFHAKPFDDNRRKNGSTTHLTTLQTVTKPAACITEQSTVVYFLYLF